MAKTSSALYRGIKPQRAHEIDVFRIELTTVMVLIAPCTARRNHQALRGRQRVFKRIQSKEIIQFQQFLTRVRA